MPAARTLTNTFAGIAPRWAPAFVAAELVGAVLPVPTIGVVLPHEAAGPDRSDGHPTPSSTRRP